MTSSSGMSEEPLMIIGTPSAAAARACTRSPRYALSALMPIGAMPNGDAWRLPNSSTAWLRPDTLRSTRVTKPNSENAARLSCSESESSAPPAMYSKSGRGGTGPFSC